MLNKIPLRIIWRDKSHFVGIILLVFLASFVYNIFSITMTNVDTNYKNFVNKYKQENFHFITFFPIDIEGVEKKYNVEIEEKFTFDYNYDDKTIRFFNITEKVNKPLILEGKMPNLGEVAIDPNFSQNNNLKIGDTININGIPFKISGYVALPDYIYITKNETDILPDPSHFGIGIMNMEDMKKFISSVAYRYYMVRGKINDIDSFKTDINSKYNLLSFQEKDENWRIIVTEKKVESGKPISYVMAITILLISSFLLFIVLRRLINSMHGEIGTLYALGYSKGEITKVYMLFPFYIWLFGSLPGGILGYIYSDNFVKFYISFISVPIIEKVFPIKDLFIGIFLPVIFMGLSGYLAIRDLLKKRVVEIIKGETEKAFKVRCRMSLSFLDKLSFKLRIMIKHALLHPSREMVIIFGVAFSTLILMYGITAGSSLSNLVYDTFQNTFKYNYMYIFNSYQKDHRYPNSERFNMLSFYKEGTKTRITIYGIEKNSQLIILRDNKGNRVDLEGFVISQALADKLNLKEGDILNVINNIDGKKYSLKVSKIVDLFVGNTGYMNLEEFNKTFGLEEGAFIGLYSIDGLNIPKEELIVSMSKSDLIKAFEDSTESVNQMLQMMYIVSFFMAFIIIYVLSSLIITENRKTLSIFKILGYRDGELSTMFLGFNNISFLLGFLIGIPLYSSFIKYIINVALRDLDFSLKMYAGFKDIAITFIILLSAFLLSKYLGRRKIRKILPGVILKEQTE